MYTQRKNSIIVALVVISVVVAISLAGTAIYSTFFYQNIPNFSGWTLIPSKTPTQVQAASPEIQISEPNQVVSVNQASAPSPLVDAICTYPKEYWLEHTDLWPRQVLMGTVTYSPEDIQRIVAETTPSVRNNLLIQLYLAYLNVFSNAESQVIEETLSEANQWLRVYTADNQLSETARNLGILLTKILSDFNFGIIGPGPCPPYEVPVGGIDFSQDGPATLTPTIMATSTRVRITARPSATSTRTRPDRPDSPTNTVKPSTNTPVPKVTSTLKPSPKPTQPPTAAPPANTPVPTQPSQPTDPPQLPTPTPAS